MSVAEEVVRKYGEKVDADYALEINEIYFRYGDLVSVTLRHHRMLKFGASTSVGTGRRTVAELGSGEVHETLPTGNVITHVASSDAGDAGTLRVVGHTLDAGEFTRVTQDVTLAGQTKTALTTPVARVERMYNASSSDWAGAVYAAEDVTFTGGVPQTAAAVHCVIPAGEQQTFKTAFTVAKDEYYLVHEVFGGMIEKGNSYADFRLEVREPGGVFRPICDWPAAGNGGVGTVVPFDPKVIIPKNRDVRVTAVADGASTDVVAWTNGVIAKVIDLP